MAVDLDWNIHLSFRIMYDYVSRSSCGDKLMVHLSDPVPVTDDGEENMKIDKTEE